LEVRVGIREARSGLPVAKFTVSLIALIVFLGCLDSASSKDRDHSPHNAPPVILKIGGVGGTDVSPSEDVVAATTCLGESGVQSRYSNYLARNVGHSQLEAASARTFDRTRVNSVLRGR
jgi:hypothetical protein